MRRGVSRPAQSLRSPASAFGGTEDGILPEGGGLPVLRRARDTLIGISDFNAALNPARTIVARQESGEPDADYPRDLTALARIQAETGDLETAEATFIKAIDLIEAAEGEYSITLVDPYRALGRSYIKAARYPEAITALEAAQHVSQRNLGLFNVEQTPLLDDITTAYLGIGDTDGGAPDAARAARQRDEAVTAPTTRASTRFATSSPTTTSAPECKSARASSTRKC